MPSVPSPNRAPDPNPGLDPDLASDPRLGVDPGVVDDPDRLVGISVDRDLEAGIVGVDPDLGVRIDVGEARRRMDTVSMWRILRLMRPRGIWRRSLASMAL